MLSSTLDGAGTIRVVDPHAIRGFCGADPDPDVQQGKAVAHRFGASQFVLGTVMGGGRKMQLKATLHESDGTITTRVETVAASEEHIFAQIDDVARGILAAEYSGPAGRLARSAAETTTSISALRHFLEAERQVVAGRWVKAREHYSLAVLDDPSLALAWMRMSWNSSWLLQPAEARIFAENALASITRLSARDTVWLHAFKAYLDGNYNESERHYRALLSRWPDDVQAYIGLGLLLVVLNPMRGRTADEAVDPLSYGRILDPQNIDARIMLTYLAARRGRYEELDSLRAWLPPDSDYKVMIASTHSIARRDLSEMAAIRSALEQAPDLLVHECARYAVVVGHDIDESHRLAALLTAAARPPHVRAIGHVLIAQTHLIRGCIRASKPEFLAAQVFAPVLSSTYRALAALLSFVRTTQRELDQIRHEVTSWNLDKEPPGAADHLCFIAHSQIYPQVRLYLLGLLSVKSGRLRTAIEHAAGLEKLSGAPEATSLAFDLALSIRAHAALAEGRAGEALSFLEQTVMQPPYERVQMQSPLFSENAERYLRARLLEDAGRLDEALHWYETMCENGLYEFVYLAPTHFRRGIIHKRLGNRDESAANFSRVTELWRNADPDLQPILRDARAQS